MIQYIINIKIDHNSMIERNKKKNHYQVWWSTTDKNLTRRKYIQIAQNKILENLENIYAIH